MLRADFVGEVVVAGQSWDQAGLQRVRFEVADAWFSRWDVGRQLALNTSYRMIAFEPGARYVVFVSGGPWEESPFTFRAESVFRVDDDGRVRCRSGNPLFGLLNDGFLCTAPELVEGNGDGARAARAGGRRAEARGAPPPAAGGDAHRAPAAPRARAVRPRRQQEVRR